MALEQKVIYTKTAANWLATILSFNSGPRPGWESNLSDYLLLRIQASDKAARLGRKKDAERIITEYLGLTDAIKIRSLYFTGHE